MIRFNMRLKKITLKVFHMSNFSFQNKRIVLDQHQKMSLGGFLPKKHAFRNFTKITGKHLCRMLLLKKLQGLGLHFY